MPLLKVRMLFAKPPAAEAPKAALLHLPGLGASN